MKRLILAAVITATAAAANARVQVNTSVQTHVNTQLTTLMTGVRQAVMNNGQLSGLRGLDIVGAARSQPILANIALAAGKHKPLASAITDINIAINQTLDEVRAGKIVRHGQPIGKYLRLQLASLGALEAYAGIEEGQLQFNPRNGVNVTFSNPSVFKNFQVENFSDEEERQLFEALPALITGQNLTKAADAMGEEALNKSLDLVETFDAKTNGQSKIQDVVVAEVAAFRVVNDNAPAEAAQEVALACQLGAQQN